MFHNNLCVCITEPKLFRWRFQWNSDYKVAQKKLTFLGYICGDRSVCCMIGIENEALIHDFLGKEYEKSEY